jgi:SAM-dependent methyltransferase
VDGYEKATYGERWAGVYDGWVHYSIDGCIDRLTEFSGAGPVLELGSGTGRVTIPLARQGIELHAIEASQAMIDVFNNKEGASLVKVIHGDMAEVDVDVDFSLVYCVGSTLWCLPTQMDQARCVANAARHLTPGGRLVISAWVPDRPDPARWRYGQRFETVDVGLDYIILEGGRRDDTTQLIELQSIVLRNGSYELYPKQLRYLWPSELDLMAQMAGLSLESRWGGWLRQTFTGDSPMHVSTYVRPPL